MTTFKINKHLYVEAEYYETRYSWGHKARLYRDNAEVEHEKITYYNRTWESYTFESILRCLADKAKHRLTPAEYKQFYKKIESNWKEEDEQRFSSQLKSVAMAAALGNILAQTPKESNDWKARMLQAGLPGLEIPEDWEQLSEDDKAIRLDAVINNLNK